MCAISASPEAGDTSNSIMSARRKCSAISDIEKSENVFFSKRSKNADLRDISKTPSNLINTTKNNVYEEFASIQHDHLRKIKDIEHEYCGFSYYRSNKINGSQDAVLVKDIGVSCSLLKEPLKVDPNTLISGVEHYLVKQLKLEYNELLNITKKINTYTKDILNNLASKCRKKEHAFQKLVTSKRVVASQYKDEAGNPCLKLRLRNDVEKKYRLSEIDLSNSCFEKDIVRQKMHDINTQLFIEELEKRILEVKRRRLELDRAIPKKFLELSAKHSSVLLRNYLLMKREKVSGNAPKIPLRKVKNSTLSGRPFRDRDVDKSREFFYMTKCDSAVLTNWREVSRQKECRSKNAFTASTSDGSRCIINYI